MKKGFSIVLALILALTLTVPAFGSGELPPAPEVTETEPVETPAPEETEPPAETSAPEGTEPPEETPVPEETPTPVESEPPEETPAPVETESPEETPVPVETEPPEETPAPVETESPEETPVPVESEPPEETSAPEENEVLTEEDSGQQEDNSPIIDVTVPESGQIVINPYGLPVEMNGETSTEQIVGEKLTVINHSEVPVTVWASAVGDVSPLSVVSYASEPPADAGEKEVFLYAEFQAEGGTWSGAYSGADNQIRVSEQISEPKAVLTLDADAEGVFRLFGAASVAPEEPWSADDGISVTFTFTFTTLDDSSVPESVTAEEPVEEPAETPVEDPAEKPTETPAEDPAEEPTETPAEDPAEEPVEPPVEDSAGEPSDVSGTAQEPDAGDTTEGAEEPDSETREEPADVTLQPVPEPTSGEENQDSALPDGAPG